MPNIIKFGSGGYVPKKIYDIYDGIDLISSVTYTTVNGTVSVTKNSNGIVLYDQYLGGSTWSQTLFTFNPQIDITGYDNIFIEVISAPVSVSDATMQMRFGTTDIFNLRLAGTYKFMKALNTNDYLRLFSSLFGGNATYTIKRIWLIKLN